MRLICYAVFIFAGLQVTACSTVEIRSENIFRDLIVKRLAAHSAGNAAAYRALLDEAFVHTDDTGRRRTLQEMETFNSAPTGSTWTVGTLHMRDIGKDLVVVECEVAEHIRFGSRVLNMPLQETDVFLFKNGRWVFLSHAETHKLDSPSPISVEAEVLEDYVGQYEWWPGFVDTVTRQNDKLYIRSNGDDKDVRLLAATREAFFIEGDPAIVVFVRDVRGKVTGEIIHFPDGKTVRARRIEGLESK